MIIFGGINDFNQTLNDTIIYDLVSDSWVTSYPIQGFEMPAVSHSSGYSAFYKQRNFEKVKHICDL